MTSYDIWTCPACGIRLSVASPGPGNLICGCTVRWPISGTRMVQLGRRIINPVVLDVLIVDCGDYRLRVVPSWQ